MAGLSVQLTGPEVQAKLGVVARDLHQALETVEDGANFLAANDDAALLSLYNISGGDAALLRSAFGDMAQLLTIYRGDDDLAVAKDFTVFVARIYGLGF